MSDDSRDENDPIYTDLDDTKRKLERSRAELNAWRERLRRRLEEADRKRQVLSGDDARRAAMAPTARIVDGHRQRAAAGGGSTAPTASTARRPERADEVTPEIEPEPGAATRAMSATAIPASGGEEDPPDRDGWAEMAPEPAAPRAVTVTGQDRSEVPSAWLPSTLSAALGSAERPAALSDDWRPSAGSHTYLDDITVPRVTPEGASPILRAAAMLLDILFLLVLPAVLLSVPVTWLAPGRGLALLWSDSARLLMPLFLAVFVFLETVYIGGFGRTPGLRLLGLRVVDAAADVPAFTQAAVRAVLFPLLLVPLVERLAGTRTVSD